MIARNFIRFPEALAAQLCLDFGALVKWATKRPGSRILRAIRAERAQAVKAAAARFVPPWFGPVCADLRPRWDCIEDIERRKRAKALANAIKAAILPLIA